MDDVLETVGTEAAEETEETTAGSEEVTAETDAGTTETADGAATEVTAEGAGAGETGTGETDAAPFLTVTYLKQQKGLTRDEAQTLAQKGMKWDAFMETHNKLAMLAEGSGYDSVDKLVDALTGSRESMELQKLIGELGEGKEELAKEILRARKAERIAKFKPIEQREREADEEAAHTREETEAAQLAELTAEMPEYSSMDKIPTAALRMANEKGITLLDAVLRYRYGESKRAQAEAEKQQSAAKASTGSLKGEPEEQDNDISAFTDAFFRGLGR